MLNGIDSTRWGSHSWLQAAFLGGFSRFAAALIAFALFLSVSVRAQFRPANPSTSATRPEHAGQSPSGERPTFSTSINLVRLLVTVRDQSGALVGELSQNDFKIADTGVPQKISIFERSTSVPISVAILIDTSGSTERDLHLETDSVLRFINSLIDSGNPQDTFALFSFNWRTNLEADYSRNGKRAEQALHRLKGEGGTSLYDAIYLASDGLAGRQGRHVIVVVTDGGDTTSYKKYSDALRAAQTADAVLYPIVVVPIAADAGRNLGGEHALATLAESTGGRTFNPDVGRVDRAFDVIINELRTQYLLGFYPDAVSSEPRKFHPVAVQVANRLLQVSARNGYYEP